MKKAVVLAHPGFLGSQSMPKFAGMIFSGLQKNGWDVSMKYPKPFFWNIPFPVKYKKWLGYLDQFFIFQIYLWLYSRLNRNVLFILADQALGPWVYSLGKSPLVVHVHDFLALRSSLGEIEENSHVSLSGKIYQGLIKSGFSRANNFICVSNNTKADLERFVGEKSASIKVVYNGFNNNFCRVSVGEASKKLREAGFLDFENGYILHVGGNQWYKNRKGVISLYAAYVKCTDKPLPLYMVGNSPSDELLNIASEIPLPGRVIFKSGLSTEQVISAYSCASAFLFPSLAEGFGWPIAEAMACGCPVITTREAPMTEVGSDLAFYIDRMPFSSNINDWVSSSLQVLFSVLSMNESELDSWREKAADYVKRFDIDYVIGEYEKIYMEVYKTDRVF